MVSGRVCMWVWAWAHVGANGWVCVRDCLFELVCFTVRLC